MAKYTYVVHDCRNCKNGTCNNRFLFRDFTKVKNIPASWAYCKECCKKLGINFDKQKPSDYRENDDVENATRGGDNAPN